MAIYLPRLADDVLREMVLDHPAVLVTGPRATGKTTTATRAAASTVRLSDPGTAGALSASPRSTLERLPEPILVDEWQVVPETLAAIKDLVDEAPRRGRFVVTGSVRGELDSPTWPGTGRLVRLEMFGLTEREIEGHTASASWLAAALGGDIAPVSSTLTLGDYIERALRSGFPEPALELAERGRGRWLRSYVDQLVTRDAEEVAPGRDPDRVRRYLHALALSSAGVVDDVTLYDAARLSKDTARAYDRLLRNLLVIDLLPAWTSNRLKRLTLAPKRFLVDAGLLVGILGVTTTDVLRDANLLGRVVETFVVAQLRAELAFTEPRPRLHHLRTAQGRHEVDVVIELGAGRLFAIEIKATSAPDRHDARHLAWLRAELGDQLVGSVLFHTGPHTFPLGDGVWAVPIAALWE